MQKTFDYKLNMIKWIGIITMTIDHAGAFLFPQYLWLRLIGRIAFPCFLYSTVEGTLRTRDYKKYITRLLLLGVISMPITPNTINVVFLLAVFSLSIKYQRYFLVFLLLSVPTEYSVYGFLFGWSIYWIKEHNVVQGIVAAGIVQFIIGISLQAYSVLSIPLFLSEKAIKLPRLPKYFFYWYYPLHQVTLILLSMWMIY
ncbi:TraX family protein [Marinilactibacillus sp. XAAS-LB27]|uniref:TraX family protein n=1 Tax=Marinilactibacillus sp. XAAS-LB27 TaxID=3114538 RepID=UPI002E18CE5E|nr:TraX family protein [Marinilactibacillus sp. XAAS-LB27]